LDTETLDVLELVIDRVPVTDELPDLLVVEEPVFVLLEVPVFVDVIDLDELPEDVPVLLVVELTDELLVAQIVHVENPDDVSLRVSIELLL